MKFKVNYSGCATVAERKRPPLPPKKIITGLNNTDIIVNVSI
jgi:hypothetical protein